MDYFWVGALSGGLAGSIFTLIGQRVLRWWDKPVLLVEFGPNVEGSSVKRSPIVQANGTQVPGFAQWVRVKITNVGRSQAQNVRVMIASVQNGPQTDSSEVIDCGWAHIAKDTVDIPRKKWRFADVCVLQAPQNGNSELFFTGKGGNVPINVQRLTLSVMVSTDNGDTTVKMMRVRYSPPKGLEFE